MSPKLTRRATLGLGAAAATVAAARTLPAAAGEGTTAAAAPTTPAEAAACVARVYREQSARAGGIWNSAISVAAPDGTLTNAVEDKVDEVVEAYSVNKIPVAVAVLDKIDRGLLTLDQRVDVPADIVIAAGDGIIPLDRAYPSTFTLGHVMSLLLTVSDDTCVRLCGLVCPARELNEILVAKGFPKTQVVPVANPNRFFLGQTTPREMHDLLRALVNGTLLSATATDYLLTVLRSPAAFTDGIRRVMSSDQRSRIATKAGWLDDDELGDGRNEAGVMFDTAGRPVLTYALFARGQGAIGDFGATHPAVQARSVMGPAFLDAVGRLGGDATTKAAPSRRYQPSNGG